MTTQKHTKLPFSHLTALLYPKLHFIEYSGEYNLPQVPAGPGKYTPFDDRDEFLHHWLHLAIEHRKADSVHSLVPEVLHFYHFHLQKFFADIQYDLEAFCKTANRTALFDELLLMMENAFFHLQELFEADLLLANSSAKPLSMARFHYTTYDSGRADIEQHINSFATTFFTLAKKSYTNYANQLCDLLNAIGKNVSIAYPGESAHDYLRRQTGLREQYKFEN